MCIRQGYNVRKKRFDRYDHWATHFKTKVIMNHADDIEIDKECGSPVYNIYR